MDLEGLAKLLLRRGLGREKIIERLAFEIGSFKDLNGMDAKRLAEAVLSEVAAAEKEPNNAFLKRILNVPKSAASMHDLGVGCRGEGDFFVHRLIGRLAGGNSLIPPEKQDDAGAVKAGGHIVVAAVDGMHSRLSAFPFIAGFHASRAAMRDVMVKGARPVALIDDLHLGDDGDVGKLFDFVAGVASVGELAGVPLIAGSTLRTGGDMVIGERMVAGVGSIGIAERLLKRSNVRPGDSILMTSGSGGGTIATAAIYSGNPDIVMETLNIDFIAAVNSIFERGILDKIDAMLDVTNGGLRGDAGELCMTAGVGLELEEDAIRGLVNQRVLGLLEKLGIDYLGVSLDSLLIFCPEESAEERIKNLKGDSVGVAEVGRVVKGRRALLDGRDFSARFRESAYTPLKKAVGESAPLGEGEMREGAERAAIEAAEKIKLLVEHIKNGNPKSTGP